MSNFKKETAIGKIALFVGVVICILVLLFIVDLDIYLNIAIVISLSMLAFSFLNDFKAIRKKYAEGFNFALTFLATLFGVYFAISISNSNEKNIEKAKNIEITDQIREDLESYILTQKDFFLTVKKSLGTNDSVINIRRALTMKRNYVFPKVLDIYSKDLTFVRSMSPNILGLIEPQMNLLRANIEEVQDSTFFKTKTISNLKLSINQYLTFAYNIKYLMNLQKQIYNNDVKKSDIRDSAINFINNHIKTENGVSFVLDSTSHLEDTLFFK